MAGNVVRVTLLSDAQRFKAGFKDAEATTESFGKKVGLVGGVIVAALAVKALGAVKDFVGDTIRAYSNLEQASGAVETVFGALGSKISKFAKGAAQDVGLSESAFKTLAANIGGQLQNMGFSVDEAADKTIDLIKTGADLAATYGGTVTDAVSAISSLLRGERDPIEKYAIGIKDADVQARNLAEGLDISTPAAKRNSDAISALAILMEQSGKAQGQFAREQDTIAGKTERANAQIENNKALVGQALSAAYSKAIPLTTTLSSLMATIAINFMESTGAMTKGEAALAKYTATTGEAVETIAELLPLIEEQIEKEERLARQRDEGVGGGLDAIDNLEILRETLDGMLTSLELSHEELISWNEDFKRSPEYIALTAEELAVVEEVMRQHTATAKINENQLAENKARMEALTGATEEQEEAQEELNVETKTGTELMREAHDELRKQTDALYAVSDAEKDVSEKQAIVNQLVADGKAGTEEHIAAVRDLDEALWNLSDAEINLIEKGALTRDEFINQRTAMGMARADAELLADQYDYLFQPRSVTHNIHFNANKVTGPDGRTYGGGQASGGPVKKGVAYKVGELGEEVFVPDEDGEIIPNHKISSGGTPVNGLGSGQPSVTNIYISALEPRTVVELLKKWVRDNGGRSPF